MYFSYRGEHLSYLIPVIYTLNSPGTIVYVISPWINSRVELTYSWKPNNPRTTLIDLCISEKKRGIDTIIITSDMSSQEPISVKSVQEFKNAGFQVTVIQNLHSKAVIGEYLKYQGSANITHSGIYRNSEYINILPVLRAQQEEVRALLS